MRARVREYVSVYVCVLCASAHHVHDLGLSGEAGKYYQVSNRRLARLYTPNHQRNLDFGMATMILHTVAYPQSVRDPFKALLSHAVDHTEPTAM